MGIFGICADLSGEIRLLSGNDGNDAIPAWSIAGKLEHVSTDPRCTPVSGRHGPAGYLSPRRQPSFVGIGVDDHSRRRHAPAR